MRRRLRDNQPADKYIKNHIVMEGEQDDQYFMRTEEESCESARQWDPNPTQHRQKHWNEQGNQWPRLEPWNKHNDPWGKKKTKNTWTAMTDS